VKDQDGKTAIDHACTKLSRPDDKLKSDIVALLRSFEALTQALSESGQRWAKVSSRNNIYKMTPGFWRLACASQFLWRRLPSLPSRGLPSPQPRGLPQSADWEIGGTAGLETCATNCASLLRSAIAKNWDAPAAGNARARRISAWICNERATPPAGKRTSQLVKVIS
jgi:hypothetical protein